jgi:hypothetical protein
MALPTGGSARRTKLVTVYIDQDRLKYCGWLSQYNRHIIDNESIGQSCVLSAGAIGNNTYHVSTSFG